MAASFPHFGTEWGYDRKLGRLNDLKARRASVGKHFDGDGLFLHVTETGARIWRVKYRLGGREQTYTIGEFAQWPLREAREETQRVRRQIRDGLHPTVEKRKRIAENLAALGDTFGRIARSWHEHESAGRRKRWTEHYATQVWRSLELHVQPSVLWDLPIRNVTAGLEAQVLKAIAARAPDMADKVAGRIAAVFAYAAAHGVVDADPTAIARKVLSRRSEAQDSLPAITELAELGKILRRAARSNAGHSIRKAFEFTAYTAQRAAEICGAQWSEIDLEERLWHIPRARMKIKHRGRGAHSVPLSVQALAVLAELPREGSYLFPSPKDSRRPISPEGVEKFARETLQLRDRHTPHGWRSAFSTNAHAATNPDGRRTFDADDVEHVLDHEERGKVRAAYDRQRSLPRLRAILDWWGAKLEEATREAAQ